MDALVSASFSTFYGNAVGDGEGGVLVAVGDGVMDGVDVGVNVKWAALWESV